MKAGWINLKFFRLTAALLLFAYCNDSLTLQGHSTFLSPSADRKILPLEDEMKFVEESETEGLFVSPETTPLGNRDISANDLKDINNLNVIKKREITANSSISRRQQRTFVTHLSNLADDLIDSFSEFAIGLQDIDLPSLYGNMSTEEIFQSYIEVMRHVARKSSNAIVRTMISSEEFYDVDLSSDCQMALMQFVFDMRDFKSWPFKMLDATPFLGTGNIGGSTGHLGSYDQCLDISEDIQGKKMYGMDCLLGFSAHPSLKPLPRSHNITFFHGTNLEMIKFAHLMFTKSGPIQYSYIREMCVPSLCTSHDVSKLLKSMSDKFQLFTTTAIKCESKEDQKWTSLQIYLGAFYGALIAMVLVGTVADYLCRGRKQSFVSKKTTTKADILEVPRSECSSLKILRCFSLLQTAGKLWPTVSRKPTFPGINGIKTISMAMVVYGHTYISFLYSTVNDFPNVFLPQYVSRIILYGLLNTSLVVDSFFLLSGMFLSVTFNRLREKIRPWHLIHMFVFRYFRLMPSVLGAVGLIYLLPVVTSGPLAYYVRQTLLGEKRCSEHWWMIALFAHNYHLVSEMCLPPTWYTSTDMQLFALFLVPVYIFTKWPKKGGLLLVFLTSSAFGFTYYRLERHYSNLLEKVDYDRNNLNTLTLHIAFPLTVHMYLHIVPFAFGIGLERLLFFKADVRLSKCIQATLWTLTIGILSSILWGTYNWREYYGTFDPPPKLEWLLFYLLRNTGWAIALSWIIFALVTGRVRIVEIFLENKMMTLLGRTSLSMLLMHLLVQASLISQLRGNISLSHYFMNVEFVVAYVISIFVAIIFYAVIESPFCEVQTLVFRKILSRNLEQNKSSGKHQDQENGSAKISLDYAKTRL